MLYDFGPRLLKLRKDKNLTQQMVVERAKGFDPNLRLSDSVLGKYESDLAVPRLTEAGCTGRRSKCFVGLFDKR